MLSFLLRFVLCTLPILILDGLRLIGFVLLLAPGFCRFLFYYAAVARRVTFRYDTTSCRQSLDVYFPHQVLYRRACAYKHEQQQQQQQQQQVLMEGSVEIQEEELGENHDSQAPPSSSTLLGIPTVIFASGGAWLIGYKMWGSLLARALTARGVMVILPDYRNYPWGTIPDMVDDIDQVIDWTLQHVTALGGDKSQVVLVGQSAGGHLGLVSLLRRARRQYHHQQQQEQQQRASAKEDESIKPSTSHTATSVAQRDSWKPTDLKGFLSLSAPFHLPSTEPTFWKHGLDANMVNLMFGNQKETYDAWSIVNSLNDQEAPHLAQSLPPMRLYHGSADRTVPCDGAAAFATELQKRVRSDIVWNVYEGWSHTDAILEGPMVGDHRFHNDMLQAVVDWTGSSMLNEDVDVDRPLCPRILVRCAKVLMPF